MVWQFQWGDQLQVLLEMQQQTGITPKALLSQPDLEGDAWHYYQEYLEVSRDRNWYKSAPFALSSRNLLDYFELTGMPRHQWGVYRQFLLAIDQVWMEAYSIKNAPKPT